MISILGVIYSIYNQTELRDLLFLLSVGSVLSLLALILEKNKIVLANYKGRMWASIGIFIFIIFLIPSKDFVIQILLFVLTTGFILRFIQNLNKVKQHL